MKQITTMTTLTMFFLMIVSCSKDSSGNNKVLDKGNYTFLTSAQDFNQAKLNRSEDYSSAFEIVKVEKAGDTLSITVSFLKGCEVNKFEIIWNGIIMETYPSTITLFVKRNTSTCGSPGDITTQVLSVNLKECIGDESLIKEATILLSNASKKTGTDNADIAISNRN
jgi:hypothetical protein